MRLRWDRISVLVCTLLLLAVLTVRGATADGPRYSGAAARAATVARGSAPDLRSEGGGCPARPGAVVHAAPGTGRTVALTFDDGPSRWTPRVLEVLREHDVPATFFVVGRQVATAPEHVAAAASQGHLIGNHSWSHRVPPRGRAWDAGDLSAEQRRTSAALRRALGVRSCWFRPPGGVVDGAPAVSGRGGLQVALWSVDTGDWRLQHGAREDDGEASRAIVAAAVAGGTQEHPVILLHDGGGYRGATVAALPSIIRFYRERGYRFVRLDGR